MWFSLWIHFLSYRLYVWLFCVYFLFLIFFPCCFHLVRLSSLFLPILFQWDFFCLALPSFICVLLTCPSLLTEFLSRLVHHLTRCVNVCCSFLSVILCSALWTLCLNFGYACLYWLILGLTSAFQPTKFSLI